MLEHSRHREVCRSRRELEDLSRRIEMIKKTMACTFHLRERRNAPRIIGLQEELRLPKIVCCAQIAIHCRADVADAFLRLSTRQVALGNSQPFPMPTFLVSGNHPA